MNRLLALLAGILCTAALGWTGTRQAIGPTPVRNDAAVVSGFVEMATYPGGVIAVFEDLRTGGILTSVSAVRYDAAGNRLDATGIRLTTQAANHWDPSVACLGTTCLAVWHRMTTTDDLVGVTIDVTSGSVGPVRTLVADGRFSGVAASGGGFVVVSGTTSGMVSRRVDATGVPVGATTSISGSTDLADNPLVLVGSAGLLTAWVERGGMLGSRALDGQGVPTAAARTHSPGGTPFRDSPLHGIWDGSRFVLLWANYSTLRVQRLDAAGALIDASPVTLVSAGIELFNPAIAFDGSHYLVAWGPLQQAAALRRFDTGTLAPFGPTLVVPVPDANVVVNLAWNGTGLLTLEVRQAPLEVVTRARSVQVLPDAGLSVTSPPGGHLVEASSAERQPRGVWTGGQYTVTWWENVETGAVVRARTLSALGGPVSPTTDLTDAGTVAWKPTVGFDGQRTHAFWHEGMPQQTFGGGWWWRRLPATGVPPAPARILNDLRDNYGGRMASFAQTAAIVWSGDVFSVGYALLASRVPMDGGTPEAPVTLRQPAALVRWATVGSSGAQALAAWVEDDSNIRWSRLSTMMSLLDTPPIQTDSFSRFLSVASDGKDFLVSYTQGYDTQAIRAIRVSELGVRLGAGPLTLAPSNPLQHGETLLSSAAFDGKAYRVAYEVPSATGVDLYWRRVWSDGGMEPAVPLVAGADNAQQVSLVEGGPGRLLVLWQQFEPATQALRIYAMPWAEVELGNPCFDSLECLSGTCAAGRCCDADAGACAAIDAGGGEADGGDAGTPDGSTGGPDGGDAGATEPDGGEDGPLRVHVGCDCQSAWGGGWAVIALAIALLRGAQRRTRGG